MPWGYSLVVTLQLDPTTFALSHRLEDPSAVQRWNGVLIELIEAHAPGPTVASRAFALLNSGFYDLWAAQDGAAAPVYGPNAQLPSAGLEPVLHRFAAEQLLGWFPDDQQLIAEALQAAAQPPLTDSLEGSPWAEQLQQQLVAMPLLDPGPSSGPMYEPVAGAIDRWTPEHIAIDDPASELESFLTPYWGSLPAFASTDVTLWRPSGPEPFLLLDEAAASLDLAQGLLTLESDWLSPQGELHLAGAYNVRDPLEQEWLLQGVINPAFIAQAEQVVEIQGSLSDAEKLSAEFWESGSGTSFPPGNWMVFTSWMAEREQLSLSEQIKLFFSVGQAVGDAGIAAWDSKLFFDYARPVRVIRDLASLGLLEGEGLEAWDTYQNPLGSSSPPFAEYVSGHSSFSAAAAAVLEGYFGSDQFGVALEFAAGSSRFEPGITPAVSTTLQWDTFSAAAESAGFSRLYGGIHFSDGNLHGLTLGEEVGADVLTTARQLAYAELEQELLEPYGLRNTLQVLPAQALDLDGAELPPELERLLLGGGSDRIELSAGAQLDALLDGGLGVDQLRYADGYGPVQVNLQQGQATGLLQLWGVEQVVGTAAPDHLTGDGGNNWLQGNGGDDQLRGGGGWDVAIYRGSHSDYRFAGHSVLDQRDPADPLFDGADQLWGIEELQFADGAWPVSALFEPATASVRLLQPAQPLTLQEGEPLQLSFERSGDLSAPLQLDLGWQPQLGASLRWADFDLGGAFDLSLDVPADQSQFTVELPTYADGVVEGEERGYLQLQSITASGAEQPLLPLQLNWSADALPLKLIDAPDDGKGSLPVQQLSSSPLPIWWRSGEELTIPISYSTSDDVSTLPGLSFALEALPAGVSYLGFDPDPDALAAADWMSEVPRADGARQFSWVSVSGGWPEESAGALPQRLGELRLAVSDQFNPVDGLTGLGFGPVEPHSGFELEITQPRFQEVKDWSLDVDGDGQVNLFSDGMMLIRYLVGLRGSKLTQGLFAEKASRTSSAAVEAWISEGEKQGLLDIDGDGRTSLHTDGLTLFRSMIGLGGSGLIGSISPGSPLLEGHSFDELSTTERSWVADQVQARIDVLS